ncbi:putative TetR-family transcriptional regulator [Actinoplanes missouriensis 431]|uniref:Putative TetR-family transcriptional regulator n=1 Tax=Actinoplanes missouriensis (strain ATCC 14538 / DSM 43046 / CBS 188.64 / JCM 3121 / NBRC 102363 / NCIMB 12654 / NRRL B-3342 / UNCC 431) TaxID=512565 RepID=I0HD33_ACTM4|nr:TetR/AcrR family transcriptional regulator C-terminal domain-containing protein [Actinoplanes missouriensis]BAL90920.1 putative TetR-family transcriptional regulator [Actinoplanes missouriensis 431]
MTSVWLRPEPDRRRRQPQLSRESITVAAVGLLDAEGVDGLTMRRLAAALGVTSTALYWHVETRDDVLDLAVDHVFGAVPIPEKTEWRADARTLVRGWRRAMLDHPWAAALIGRPMLGPNVLARTEFLQEALSRGGLKDRELTVATRLLANYVIGAALTEATWRASSAADREAARRHVTAACPTLVASRHLAGPERDDDEIFERGLDVILR